MQTDYDALCDWLRARSPVRTPLIEAADAITTLREELREARESADRLAEALEKFLADAGIVSVAVDREARAALAQHRSKP